MFWKFDLHTTSHIDQLLDREDVTLRELMEEDDVLQECKAQNRRLLLFLSQDHCMQELVSLITTEPPADLEERSRFKFPNIACELLTSDVSIINDKLGGDESLLEMLYHFLEQDPPLNPLLASFFSKTIGNLIARKTEQVITFLKKKEGFIGLVLKHIDASAMMDLLLRLISCVEPAPLRQEVLHWLNEEKLVQRLSELIHTGKDEERQSNASQTLCDIIRLSRDQANQMQENVEADPLLAVLESNVKEMLPSVYCFCLLVSPRLEGLMDLYSQGYERSYTVNSSILNAIEPHLKDFQQLLLDPPKKSAILTTVGVLEQPLGNARLHVARLVAALLQTNAPSICQELCNLATMDLLLYLPKMLHLDNCVLLRELSLSSVLLTVVLFHALCHSMSMSLICISLYEQDLFFKYSWNNFLHFQVELCVAAILNHPSSEERPSPGLQNHDGKPAASNPEAQGEAVETGRTIDPQTSIHNALVAHLFQKCRLVQRILDAWEENDRIQVEGGTRRGNMGHLTRIANMVVQNLEKGPVQAQITDLIKELPEDCRGRWESFVDETLRETNRRNTVELVSTHNMHSSSEDDDMESPFPNDLSLQQAFSDYQIQQMTANFVDQFGFNDEEFNEHDDNINATFDRIAEINFNLDADDNSANAAAFEACCKERIRQFDDAEEEEDIWEEKEINYATQAKSRTRFGVSQTSEGSSRNSLENGGREQDRGSESDEDEDSDHNTSDTGPGWTANFRDSGGTAASQTPAAWDNSAGSGAQRHPTGWANFTEFQPFYVGASSGAWPVGEGRKAPLVASDSSSSGGSDSEEDDKNAGAPPSAATPSETAGAPGNKTADLKRFATLK
uniref:Protein phosphatase 6, regulatory subunit 2a n=1 Tax=Lates calcarifer TaxID=8187 RepID=A0A4W6E8K1_LATCA